MRSNAIAGARDEYLAHGFKDYLSKPIDIHQLEDMLVKYLPPEKVHYLDEEAASQEEAADTPDTASPADEQNAEPGAASGDEEGKEAADETFTDRLAKAGFNIDGARGYTMDDDEFYMELLETFVSERLVVNCYHNTLRFNQLCTKSEIAYKLMHIIDAETLRKTS